MQLLLHESVSLDCSNSVTSSGSPLILLRLLFPGSSPGKESACNAGDPGLIPGSGRSPGEGIGYPTLVFMGFPGGSDGKKSDCTVGDSPWFCLSLNFLSNLGVY